MKKFILILFVFTSTIFSQVTGDLKGVVFDKFTKQPLPGVNVILIGTNFGAATDSEGKFEIPKIEFGRYQVKVSFVGYNSSIKTDVLISSAKNTFLEFELTESAIELEGVTVTTDYFELEPSEINSLAKFSYEEIRRQPGGFEDVLRALSVIPGVGQVSAGRNDLIVRGGAPSENLFLVDGLVIPNINHFGSQGSTGGPLSYVNLDFVKTTSFSTGGFSSMYGDKLSSVLKIDLRDGRTDRFGGKATISASQFGLNLEGPINTKGSYVFSVRRSYLDFIFNAAGFNFVPEYWDGLAKFDYNFNTENKLSFLFIGALDKVKFNNNDAEDLYDNSKILGSDQNQYVGGLTYRHLFGEGFYTIKLSRNFVEYESFQRDTLLNPIFRNFSTEIETGIKADLVYKLSSTSELNLGVSTKLINFETDVFLSNFRTSFGDVLNIKELIAKKDYNKSSLYLQYSDVFMQRLKMSAGLRGDYFNGIENGFEVSPRLSFSYQLSPISSLNFSTGIYYQSPSYIWLSAVASNKNLKMTKVNQFIAGFDYYLRDDIRLKIEGFYKDYRNYPTSTLRPYLVLANTGAGFGGSDDNFASFGLDPLVSEGKGNSKGVELSVQKKSSDSPLYGILSLTVSETKFTPLNGIEQNGTYDQRLIGNLSGGYIFNEKWEVSFKVRFATGSPYTPFDNNGNQSVAKFNRERFSLYHTLDLRVDRRWKLSGLNLITYLDIQNIYNKKNETQIRWNSRENKIKENNSIGLLPSIGVSLEF